MDKIIYEETLQQERLDKFLVKKFWFSRNFFHHIIQRGWVLVNWKTTKKSYNLKPQDEIQIENLQRFTSTEILQDFAWESLDVLLEEKDYLVVYKPKWILSHPGSIWDISSPSVVWFIYQKFKDTPYVWNFIRAWLIHRLDKETDWPMIIVKTEKWLQHFKELFHSKSNAKTINQKESIPLKKFYKATAKLNEQGQKFFAEQKKPFYIQQEVIPKVPRPHIKEWITKIINVKQINDYHEIYMEILTGRTHQIRYHLSANWAKILWDYLYWQTEWSKKMLLSCSQIEFKDVYWDYKIINNTYL